MKVAAVVGALAAVFTALAAISNSTITIFNNSKFLTIKERNTLAKSGEFEVKADKSLGEPFTNEHSRTEDYEFFARGEWSYNNTSTYENTDEKVGSNNPDGHPNHQKATSSYKLPGVPEGALIVRRPEEQSYQLIGSREKLTLDKGETVYFTINDVEDPGPSKSDPRSDNSGTLTVEWNCRTCR